MIFYLFFFKQGCGIIIFRSNVFLLITKIQENTEGRNYYLEKCREKKTFKQRFPGYNVTEVAIKILISHQKHND